MPNKIVKKLYTLYEVEGTLEGIKRYNKDKFVSYCGGIGVLKKYYDSFNDWIEVIAKTNLSTGFGLEAKTADGEEVNIHRYDLECNMYCAKNYPIEKRSSILANILTYYFEEQIYYTIKEDYIWMNHSYTGHQYYRSPYESDDNCGTCDGARCDYCTKMYRVYNQMTDEIYYYGRSESKAKSILAEKSKKYPALINDFFNHFDIDKQWVEENIGQDVTYTSVMKIVNQYKIPYITN